MNFNKLLLDGEEVVRKNKILYQKDIGNFIIEVTFSARILFAFTKRNQTEIP